MVAEKNIPGKQNIYKWNIIWPTAIVVVTTHLSALYGLYLLFSFKVCWQTVVFYYIYHSYGILSITAGVHRLWAHRAYKAKLPLRIFLMIGQTTTYQRSIFYWVRDHRTHHKFVDTDADPYNARRGLFFSHIGWLLIKKQSAVFEKGKAIDMSDVLRDPVVRFQKKYYNWLVVFWLFIFPTAISWYFWGESITYTYTFSLFLFAIGRMYYNWLVVFWLFIFPTVICWYFWGENITYTYTFSLLLFTITLHVSSTINSIAHAFGMKPFDKSITPSENRFASLITLGEGWHNYHHIFPWDYKAAELGNYGFNFTTLFLDVMAKIGWATNLKTAPEDLIRKRAMRTGDGTKIFAKHVSQPPNIYGWTDKDMRFEEKLSVQKVARSRS